jgi:hypothetical protein
VKHTLTLLTTIAAGVKVRPTEKELDEMDSWPYPEFRSGWDSYFRDKPDKPVMHYSVIAGCEKTGVLDAQRAYADHSQGSETTCICLLESSSQCSTSWNIHSRVASRISRLRQPTTPQISMLE